MKIIVKKILIIVLAFFGSIALAAAPEEIIARVDRDFSKIKDAKVDVSLDTGLQLLGCGNLKRQTGTLWFKAPDKIKVQLNKTTYFLKGNVIRKIEDTGQCLNYFNITLFNAPDFSVGFNPKLIPNNFDLKNIKETSNEVVIEGLPKPGVLKNVKKVYFHIDTTEYLLRSMDLLIARGITGRLVLEYKNINGITAPTAIRGKTALEITDGMLVGLIFNFKGENAKLNEGLADKFFDPGF